MIKTDYQELERIVEENKLFRQAREALGRYLKIWWAEDRKNFQESMWADLDTVLEKYRFENDSFAFSRSYLYDPPLDYIAVRIRISNEEETDCSIYTACFNLELEFFDDQLN